MFIINVFQVEYQAHVYDELCQNILADPLEYKNLEIILQDH